jgi:hypothetical protein
VVILESSCESVAVTDRRLWNYLLGGGLPALVDCRLLKLKSTRRDIPEIRLHQLPRFSGFRRLFSERLAGFFRQVFYGLLALGGARGFFNIIASCCTLLFGGHRFPFPFLGWPGCFFDYRRGIHRCGFGRGVISYSLLSSSPHVPALDIGFGLFLHQRGRARALMLANAALRILFKRFVGFGRRLRLLASVPTR